MQGTGRTKFDRCRMNWGRRACVVAVIGLGLSGAVVPRDAGAAIPHGCASVSRDYSVAAEPMARRVAVKVHTNEPCTFIYADGDVFSGDGRFTVTCSTGGYFHHPDDLPDGTHNPAVVAAPIPQPCAVGATVTLDGYHQFTGGWVAGGGRSAPPAAPSPRLDDNEFSDLCAPGSEPAATVDLQQPVNRSGLLTYTGTVSCVGANVDLTSLTVTPLAGYAYPSAGTAECRRCRRPVSVSGTVPAKAWLYEVELKFDITDRKGTTVTGTRLGRYAVTWAGVVTTLCPGFQSWEEDPTAPTNELNVPGGETCPA